ncbi:hypothetical protein [Kaarinaea lacus]
MTLSNEEKTVVRPRLWIAIVTTTFILSYLLGYVVSAKTGVEPGFFEQPESGGYGVVAEKSAAPGLDKDLQDYYKNLTEE